MQDEPTAPVCIVKDCNDLSALSSKATGQFFAFTTYYCASCYEKLYRGEDVQIDACRIIVERTK